MKIRREKLRQYAKDLGVCSQCFRRDARKGYTTCKKCAEKNKKNARILRQRRREVGGYCSRCGGKLDSINFKTCIKCRISQSKK